MKNIFTLLAAVLLTATTFAQVGINNETPDASAALDITSTTGGLLVPRMTETQRDAITATQGLIIFCTDCASGEGELQIKLTSSWKNTIGGDVNDPLAIGDLYQGGRIFYLDGNGGGLIAAEADQSSGIQWYNGSYVTTGATGTAIGTGSANTDAIILAQGTETSYAARLAREYTDGTYTDWFLPSKDELDLMHSNIGQGSSTDNIGNFAIGFYWSSTVEGVNDDRAYAQYFSVGAQNAVPTHNALMVRAVRAF